MSDQVEFLPPDQDRAGETYQRPFDYARLNGQQRAVWNAVKDGRWRSLAEIAVAADLIDRLRGRGAPEASASARLRDFRKLGLRVDRKRIKGGLFTYRVVLNPPANRNDKTIAGDDAAMRCKGT